MVARYYHWSLLLILVFFANLANIAYSADSAYCPKNHTYISYGMNVLQVLAACGEPTYKQDTPDSVVQTIPVTQLIYSNLNQGAGGAMYQGFDPVYRTWSLPSGSLGVNLQINIINDKVASININGSNTNAVSVCGGSSIQIGSDVSSVYSACGSPSLSNETYIKKYLNKNEKPEVWIYQLEYQSPMHLTFVNGILQSID